MDLKSHETVVQISLGEKHAMLLINTGDIIGFGNNKYGQLAMGKTNSEF